MSGGGGPEGERILSRIRAQHRVCCEAQSHNLSPDQELDGQPTQPPGAPLFDTGLYPIILVN